MKIGGDEVTIRALEGYVGDFITRNHPEFQKQSIDSPWNYQVLNLPYAPLEAPTPDVSRFSWLHRSHSSCSVAYAVSRRELGEENVLIRGIHPRDHAAREGPTNASHQIHSILFAAQISNNVPTYISTVHAI